MWVTGAWGDQEKLWSFSSSLGACQSPIHTSHNPFQSSAFDQGKCWPLCCLHMLYRPCILGCPIPWTSHSWRSWLWARTSMCMRWGKASYSLLSYSCVKYQSALLAHDCIWMSFWLQVLPIWTLSCLFLSERLLVMIREDLIPGRKNAAGEGWKTLSQ